MVRNLEPTDAADAPDATSDAPERRPVVARSPEGSRGDVACTHCGLPVPRGLLRPGADAQFCCGACEVVYEAIRAGGLSAFYAIRDESTTDRVRAQTCDRGYAEFDDPAFRKQYARRAGPDLEEVELYLDGVHCAACVWLVERLPHVQPGVREARLDLRRRLVRIVWNDDHAPLSRIAQRLAALGYPPHPAQERRMREARRAEDRRALVRIAVAGAIAGNVMLLSFALYGGMLHGIEPEFATLFRWTCGGLTLASFFGPGRVFLRGAIGAIRARTTHMDIPVAVGLTTGVVWSLVMTWRGLGDVYFDSVAVLIFLLLVGRWIQHRQQQRSRDAVELLFTLTPRHARLVVEGDGALATHDVPIETILPGHLVEVRAGETVPVDGEVSDGQSELDRGWLTGESRPVPIRPGQVVHAGETNLVSLLRVRVKATGTLTRMGRLMRLVEDAAESRGPVMQHHHRIAGVLVIVVLALALVTVLAWWPHDPVRAIANAMSLLIITCPCALGLATPLAIVSAIGRAANRGILIKGGEMLERLDRPGEVFLDKTGTITEGRMSVVEWHGDDDVRGAVAAIERASAHPVARALVAACEDAPAVMLDDDCVTTTARGASGVADGAEVIIGAEAMLTDAGVKIPDWGRRTATATIARGRSPVYVARGGALVAIAGVGDGIRPDAAKAIRAVEALGWRVHVLSGDHPQIVDRVGRELGLPSDRCHGAITPEDKLRRVEAAASRGPVIMVGDGVNDAGGLAAATVGIAMKNGAEASLAVADVYLDRNGLAALPVLITGARRTRRVIDRNLVVSLLYNVVGATLAVAGLINPLVAAVLMPLSSFTVITLSFRSRTFEETP